MLSTLLFSWPSYVLERAWAFGRGGSNSSGDDDAQQRLVSVGSGGPSAAADDVDEDEDASSVSMELGNMAPEPEEPQPHCHAIAPRAYLVDQSARPPVPLEGGLLDRRQWLLCAHLTSPVLVAVRTAFERANFPLRNEDSADRSIMGIQALTLEEMQMLCGGCQEFCNDTEADIDQWRLLPLWAWCLYLSAAVPERVNKTLR
jgi:hypothetical protein